MTQVLGYLVLAGVVASIAYWLVRQEMSETSPGRQRLSDRRARLRVILKKGDQ